MDRQTLEAGVKYEQLVMRGFNLDMPDCNIGADRRHYYLLYHIRKGYDLRETGYFRQYMMIRENIKSAIRNLLAYEMHPHEHLHLGKVLTGLDKVYTEEDLLVLIDNALHVSARHYEEKLNRGRKTRSKGKTAACVHHAYQ